MSPEMFDENVYYRSNSRKVSLTIVFLVLAVLTAFFSIFLSKIGDLSFEATWEILKAHLSGTSVDNEIHDLVVWEYNVPRAIMGLFVGAGLAVGGAVMQALMRNPLADPYTTGVASGASLGAVMFFTMGISLLSLDNYTLATTTNALILSMIPTMAIVLISQHKHITPTTMILAGIAIMYVFRAATSLMMFVADPESVEEAYIWSVGTLGSASWDNIWFVAGSVTVISVLLLLVSNQVTIMTAGDRSASTMGVWAKPLRIICLLLIAIMTAIMVSFTGTIGFMGLVAPHIARVFVGSNMRYLIPCSAALGSLILIGADCLAKTISMTGMPVGVITSIIGGPIFIILLIKGAKKVWF
ncbi:MAG: iron ABC transporter permease [Candidatus Methanomethylophilaceae archaeon]|nr:iron ABC transporter permease [Candidatus Methanomethylophilaceae archaeon]